MNYYIYSFKFITPVHFGDGSSNSLIQSKMTCAADTFFSALCHEMDRTNNNNKLELFIDAVKNQKIKMSSLLPWSEKSNGEKHYYMTRPFQPVLGKKEEINDFSTTKQLATEMKKMKKVEFIRISQCEDFLKGKIKPSELDAIDFAVPASFVRVNKRESDPLPYLIGTYIFHDHAGLYLIVGFEDERYKIHFDESLLNLSFTGIGGKRSSGYGKFEMLEMGRKVENSSSNDLLALETMLNNTTSPIQIALAPLAPDINDLDIIKQGYYRIIQRSGFTSSSRTFELRKKNNCFMLEEGSTFNKRLIGRMIVQNLAGIEHSIYLNGMGLFVGVDYE